MTHRSLYMLISLSREEIHSSSCALWSSLCLPWVWFSIVSGGSCNGHGGCQPCSALEGMRSELHSEPDLEQSILPCVTWPEENKWKKCLTVCVSCCTRCLPQSAWADYFFQEHGRKLTYSIWLESFKSFCYWCCYFVLLCPLTFYYFKEYVSSRVLLFVIPWTVAPQTYLREVHEISTFYRSLFLNKSFKSLTVCVCYQIIMYLMFFLPFWTKILN